MDETVRIKNINDKIDVSGTETERLEEIPDYFINQLEDDLSNPKVKGIVNPYGGNIEIYYDSPQENKRTTGTDFVSEPLASLKKKGEVSMSDTRNFDLLFKELKDDMRERESRTREEISSREQRFEEQLKSYHQANKEREERFYQLVNEIKTENKSLQTDIKNELQNIKTDLNATKQEISNLTQHNESLATTNKWSNVTTIIGISAIVVAVIAAFITFFVTML